MSIRNTFRAQLPVDVEFGAGVISGVGERTRTLGERPLLLTMQPLVDLGLAERVLEPLTGVGLEPVVFADVEPEPTGEHVDLVTDFAQERECDVIIALGGGSVTDVAKAVALCATNPEPAWAYANLSNRPPAPIEAAALPLISVPTTAGTGAEVTPYAVLSNPETVQKGTIKDSTIQPSAAYVDPELSLGLPRDLTAATGVDAFAHALESYLNDANRSAFSDLHAIASMREILRSLPRALENPRDLQARAGMAWAATLGGFAISNAGTTVAHALAQPLGARMHFSHSVCVAIFTMPVLRQTLPHAISRLAELALALDPAAAAGLSEACRADFVVERIGQLFAESGVPLRIQDVAEPPVALIEELLSDVFGYMSRPLKQHAVAFGEAEIRAIVEEAL